MSVHWTRRFFVIAMITLPWRFLTGAEPEIEQPVQFNHYFHINDQDLDCLSCHVNVEDYRRASIPNIEICADCHEGMETDMEEARKVVNYIEEGNKIPWVQVHRVPDHAYFSHQRHVKLGKLDCNECHGEVAEKTTPFVRPYVELSMDWCLNCHKGNLVTRDCNTCHR